MNAYFHKYLSSNGYRWEFVVKWFCWGGSISREGLHIWHGFQNKVDWVWESGSD